jgi:hypothetical protein
VSDRETPTATPGDTYGPDEVIALRAQIRRANADARAELERRGVRGPHPRVQALKDAGLWPPGRDRA